MSIGVVNGKNILITMRTGEDAYTVFACGTDCTFNITRNKLELTDQSVGNWKKWIPTELTGTIEVSGVIVLYDDGKFTIFDVLLAQMDLGRLDFLATIYDVAGNEAVFSCACLIDLTSFGMPAGSSSVTNLTLTIDGEPTITRIDSFPPEDEGYNPDCVILDGNGQPILDELDRVINTDCIYSGYPGSGGGGGGPIDPPPTGGDGEFSAGDFSSSDFVV